MKKLLSVSVVFIFTTFLSFLSIDSFAQNNNTDAKPGCADLSHPITPKKLVATYADNYDKMISDTPANAIQQFNFNNQELACLATLSTEDVKFIFGAYNRKKESTKFIIVEIQVNGTYSFYDLDDMFAKIRAKTIPSNHICPKPVPCPIPFQ